MHLNSVTPNLARRATAGFLGVCCALALVVGSAYAGTPAPVIDGNGDDLIQFAGTIGTAGCSVDLPSIRGNITFTQSTIPGEIIVPCAPLEDINGDGAKDYWPNGSDLRRFIAVREGTNLYLLFRTEGFIGDTDGNGNPDNNSCDPAAQNTRDVAGIGAPDRYLAEIDLDCNGIPDIFVEVTANQVRVYDPETLVPLVVGSTQFAFRDPAHGGVAGASGHDLEVLVTGITLGDRFQISGKAGSFDDAMSEDNVGPEFCGNPTPRVQITKTASVPSICPGQTVDFTIVVTNTGNVTLPALTVVDDLDAGLVYDRTVSNTCGGAVNAVGNQITYGPFGLDAGQSCTIVLRAGRTAECQGEKTNRVSVGGQYQSPCYNDGVPEDVGPETASATVLCGNVTCSIDAPDTRVCGNETVQICGPVGAYTYLWSNQATDRCIMVGAGTYSLTLTETATGCVSDPCSVTITPDTPLIEVTKSVSPEGPVDQGTLLTYTLTVTNPAWSTIRAEDVLVTDYLCDETLYAGNANPAPTSAPAVGETGNIVWHVGPLAPGTSATITFDARIRELPVPECEATDRSCENRVVVSTSCGGGEPATDDASVITPIPACPPTGICRLTGGGCLNEDGDNRGKKQSTFGGNSSPFHEGGGPTGNSWEHVLRDGKTILFNWHSWDAYVTRCSVIEPGPCHPAAENTKAEFQGTGKYSLGAGSREAAGNMVAYIIDHKEGACNRNNRDEYYITVRTGLVIGEGEIVFQTGGEIDCGNLQIHETPKWLFSGGTEQPGTISEVESIALLNRAVPNPFRASMSYAYEITGGDQPVEIAVYNVAGRMVKSLVSSTMPAGRHTATWNGTDDAGSRAPSGVYFVRARYGAEMKQQRVIYLGQ